MSAAGGSEEEGGGPESRPHPDPGLRPETAPRPEATSAPTTASASRPGPAEPPAPGLPSAAYGFQAPSAPPPRPQTRQSQARQPQPRQPGAESPETASPFPPRLRPRRAQALAAITPVFGALLLSPPFILVFAQEATVLGVPLILAYLGVVWVGLIFGAWRLSGRLRRRLELHGPAPLQPDRRGRP